MIKSSYDLDYWRDDRKRSPNAAYVIFVPVYLRWDKCPREKLKAIEGKKRKNPKAGADITPGIPQRQPNTHANLSWNRTPASNPLKTSKHLLAVIS